MRQYERQDGKDGAYLSDLLWLRREQCTRLAEYARLVWPLVEPGRRYIHGWHIDAISEHLEAATNGDIQNLIINMPPRHMKSVLISVMWFTWAWTFRPDSRWIYASYASTLATRDSVKCRTIIQSPWYRETFGHVFQLRGDQNMKTRFENNRTGYRIATGVDGGATGEGGEFIVCDDPSKAKDATSPKRLEAAINWWNDTMSSRGNDPEGTVRLLVMQRLHTNDLTGHLLDAMARGGTRYEVLCLPAEYEPNRCILTTGWTDPRKREGELLWPERFSRRVIERLKGELTDSAGQLQQRPTASAGGVFQKSWWDDKNRYRDDDKKIKRKVLKRWITLDTAFKDAESNDPSAYCVWELWPDYRIAVRAMWEEKVLSAMLPAKIEEFAVRWNYDGKLAGIVIEDKGSGTNAAQSLRLSAPEWIAKLIYDWRPEGSKEYRARLASLWCAKNLVVLPYPGEANADWYNLFLDPERGQLWLFPNAAHDDLVDTFTMGVQYLENYLALAWQALLDAMGETEAEDRHEDPYADYTF